MRPMQKPQHCDTNCCLAAERSLIILACVHNQCPSAFSYLPAPAGEMRNDLYVTLEKGEFEKGGKSVAKNVEITVYVLDIDGQVLKVKVLLIGKLPGFFCLLTAKMKEFI